MRDTVLSNRFQETQHTPVGADPIPRLGTWLPAGTPAGHPSRITLGELEGIPEVKPGEELYSHLPPRFDIRRRPNVVCRHDTARASGLPTAATITLAITPLVIITVHVGRRATATI